MNQPSVLLLEILESVLSRFIYILVCVCVEKRQGGKMTHCCIIYIIFYMRRIYTKIERERERKKEEVCQCVSYKYSQKAFMLNFLNVFTKCVNKKYK